MATRGKGKLQAGSAALVLIVAAILVAVNVISQRFFIRVDLTEDKRFSIAPATRSILSGIDDVVNVDAWFSRDLPPYVANLRRQVGDILDEYRAHSAGRLRVEFRDPGDDPVTKQKLNSLGIPEVQLEILEKDQFRLTTAYMGIALHYGGKKEVIPLVQNVGRLEYELTSAILRLTAEERKAVGWIGGTANAVPGGNPLHRELERTYDLHLLEPGDLQAIPPEVKTLVVEGPRELSGEALLALDQYVVRGGSALFLVDHFTLQPGGISPVPIESGVHDLLEHYGVRVEENVVVEPYYNAQASFSSGFMQFRLPYPYWPRITRDFLNREHPVTADLESIVLPWTSALEITAGEDSGIEVEILAASSPRSWTTAAPYDFSPRREVAPPRTGEEPGGRPLAVLLRGRFAGFRGDGETPAAGEGADPPAVTAVSPETSLLVLGTSRPVTPEFLQQFPEMSIFVMNAVDWMTLGSDLIGIRSRSSGERTLPELPEGTKAILKAGNVVVLPLCLALFGVVYLALRRRKKDGR